MLTLAGCSRVTSFVANEVAFDDPGVREPIYRVERVGAVAMTTRDGTRLVADVYHPRGVRRGPTILVRIPFTDTFKNRSASRLLAHYWATRGYHVVVQGTRGRYHSGGVFYPLVSERDDGIDTLSWLADQPWYDGRLAMWGGSAFGYTQWAISDQVDPGASAYFVQIASSDFHGMFHEGGAFALESALFWAMRSRPDRERRVSTRALERATWHVPLLEADDVTVGDTAYFNDWLLHRERGEYWRSIDGDDRTRTLSAPVLLLGGWFDPFLPTQLKDYRRIVESNTRPGVADETRLVIGPWVHAQPAKLPPGSPRVPYRAASVVPSIPWFDAQLQAGADERPLPKVRIFVMGRNQWRDENEWPLARTRYTPWYLGSSTGANGLDGDGALVSGEAPASRAFDAFIYDPASPVPTAGGAMLGNRAGVRVQNGVESRQDVLVYSSAVLDSAVEVTGPVKVVLFVDTDAPSTDFTAKLVDVHPDGTAYNLGDGIRRRSYAGNRQGEPVRIEIDLTPTSNVFLEGHRIRLDVSSSNFPRFDRNPNTGRSLATTTLMRPARQRVFHSAAYPSHVILPVIP